MKYKQSNRQIIPYKKTDLVGKYMNSGNMYMLIIMLSCAILNEQQRNNGKFPSIYKASPIDFETQISPRR